MRLKIVGRVMINKFFGVLKAIDTLFVILLQIIIEILDFLIFTPLDKIEAFYDRYELPIKLIFVLVGGVTLYLFLSMGIES